MTPERLVAALKAERVKAGLTQKDVAARMYCTQSRVSKLEASRPGDWSIRDLAAYAFALGKMLRFKAAPKKGRKP